VSDLLPEIPNATIRIFSPSLQDTRMMEFNGLLNRILAKSPASRRRNLYIRTFTVIPLSEDCGLVEWVPNTRGIRHILQDLYENAGLFVRRGPQATHTRVKQIYDKTSSPTDRMSQVKPSRGQSV
jgi:serine/threonine-protein kinase ATR